MPPSSRATGTFGGVGSLAAMWLIGACIIPDREIRLEVDAPENQSAIRILEPAPTIEEMTDLCSRRPSPTSQEIPEPTFCQQVARQPVRSGLVGRDLCICPTGLHDGNSIPRFSIFAEDGDLDGSTSAAPYGVFLLDLDPDSGSPESSVAYLTSWDPGRPAEQTTTTTPPVGREELPHWMFSIGRSGRSRIDLCNDSGRTLMPGLHQLTFMVTDLPFFKPQEFDAEGNPVFDERGRPRYGNTQYGVPDLAAGATYDIVNFIFECLDGQADERCNCVEDEP